MGIEILEEAMGYHFRNHELLKEALTHPTYVNENRNFSPGDNQRLEFLGDTVVNTSVTRRLFLDFPHEREGALTKRRAELVSEASLYQIALHLDLGAHLNLGRGEDLDGGRTKPSILSDAYESVMGAVFLDSSFDVASALVEKHFAAAIGPFTEVGLTDYKSTLIERCQARFGTMPQIEIVDERGPEHAKEFEAEVRINGEVYGHGIGRNKKQASQEACRETLRSLGYLRS